MLTKLFTFFFVFSSCALSAQQSEKVVLLDNWNQTIIPFNSGDAKYSEVWGFTKGAEEYGVIGSTLGTHVLLLRENNSMREVAYVPGAFQGPVVHRDYHDYNGYLYAISQQGEMNSSFQIIDLHFLPDSAPVVYDSNALFAVAHNVYIDTATAKMYVCLPTPMGNAMDVFSLEDPTNPLLLHHFTDFSQVHDVFVRNDTAFLNCANDGLWVYDFSDATSPKVIGSLTSYPDQGYNHSGWLSPNGRIYVFTDETLGKKLKVCDVSNLSDITVLSTFFSEAHPWALAHNVMYKDGLAYVSHYNDGLQIFDLRDPVNPKKIAWYDTYLPPNDPDYMGAWGIYAFLPSGRLLVSDRQTGLYMFGYNPPPNIVTEQEHGMYSTAFSASGILFFDNPDEVPFELFIYDVRGRLVKHYPKFHREWQVVHSAGLNSGMYIYVLRGVNHDYTAKGKFVVARDKAY